MEQAAVPRANPKNIVQSLAKGLRVLEVFRPDSPEMTLSEIAARADLDVGTVFRITNTLVMLGYLIRVANTKRYRLTLKVLDLGFTAIGHQDLRQFARPLLRSLVGRVNEAASLAVLDGPEVVYVERVQAGLTRLGVDIRIGSRIPAYYTVIGWSMLAFLPRAERRALLDARDRVKLSPTMPVSIQEIERGLAEVRRAGFACHENHAVPGLRFLAAPVMDADGHPIASISVVAPAVAIDTNKFVASAAGPVQEAAEQLGRALSISGPVVQNLGHASG